MKLELQAPGVTLQGQYAFLIVEPSFLPLCRYFSGLLLSKTNNNLSLSFIFTQCYEISVVKNRRYLCSCINCNAKCGNQLSKANARMRFPLSLTLDISFFLCCCGFKLPRDPYWIAFNWGDVVKQPSLQPHSHRMES